MRKRPRSRLWWSTATLVAVFFLVVLAAPWLVDLGPVRAALERQMSSTVRGEVTWKTLEVGWLPQPHAVMRGMHARFPKGTLDVEHVQMRLRLWPLLRGRAEIDSVVLTRPFLD